MNHYGQQQQGEEHKETTYGRFIHWEPNLIDTTEKEILALLALDGTTHLRENSLERMQFTDNGKFAGCIHVRMPSRTETLLFSRLQKR